MGWAAAGAAPPPMALSYADLTPGGNHIPRPRSDATRMVIPYPPLTTACAVAEHRCPRRRLFLAFSRAVGVSRVRYGVCLDRVAPAGFLDLHSGCACEYRVALADLKEDLMSIRV